MEEAFRTGSIADRITDFCSVETLKELRLVNKEWNARANGVLQQRCKEITVILEEEDDLFKKYQQLDSCLLNREISVHLPVAVVMVRSFTLADERCYCLLGALWRFNVVSLGMKISVEDASIVSILLQNLPALNKLKLTFDSSSRSSGHFRSRVFSAFQAGDVKFRQLDFVEFSFESKGVTAPDVTFLMQCPSLKTISLGGHAEMVLELLKCWKQMYLEDPTLSRFQDLRFDIRGPLYRRGEKEMLTEFINLNQPTSLTFGGNCSFDFSTIFKGIKHWSPGIQAFKTTAPVGCAYLRQFDVFANLTEISLTSGDFYTELYTEMLDIQDMVQVRDEERSLAKHHFPKTDSLSLPMPIDRWCQHWRQRAEILLNEAATELPGITRLHLSGLRLTGLFALDAIFQPCKKFSRLRHLSMDLEAGRREKEFCFRKTHYLSEDSHLKGLAVLEGLKTFTLTINNVDQWTTKEMLLESMFHGYEPHVSLFMDAKPRLPAGGRSLRHKLELSVDGFKQALMESNSVGAKWKHGHCKYECYCYELTV